jgi:hypothetical protein
LLEILDVCLEGFVFALELEVFGGLFYAFGCDGGVFFQELFVSGFGKLLAQELDLELFTVVLSCQLFEGF